MIISNSIFLVCRILKSAYLFQRYCPGTFAANQWISYGALRRSILDITPKMLTQTLRKLEEDGLVHRAVYQEVPPRVEYTLTETGKELIPFINHLRKWGEKQMEKEGVPLAMTIACAEPEQ